MKEFDLYDVLKGQKDSVKFLSNWERELVESRHGSEVEELEDFGDGLIGSKEA